MEILGVRLRADYGPLHIPNKSTAEILFAETGLILAPILLNVHTVPEICMKAVIKWSASQPSGILCGLLT